MLEPLGAHELLVFLLQLGVLLGAARGLGALVVKVGQPRIVGELGAGLLIGPSVFGRLAPEASSWLFPPDEAQADMLLAFAWMGILLLLVATGFETDPGLVMRLGRSSAAILAGTVVVPFGMGLGLGALLPPSFYGAAGTRSDFALFMAIAMVVSSIPVAAKILTDMNLLRRNVGQLTLAAGTTNDLTALVLLGVATAIVAGRGLDAVGIAVTLLSVIAFFAFALTIGQRLTDAALRRVSRSGHSTTVIEATLAVAFLIAIGAGALTDALGVEAVVGAFIAGIVLGRSRYLGTDVRRVLEVSSRAVFAPVFFATAGLRVDLGPLFEPETSLWTLAIVAVAGISRIIGAYAGRLLGHLRTRDAIAVGIGLNARGALGLVVATVALGLEVFNDTSYTTVIIMSLIMSMAAPPLLRWVLGGLRPEPEEAERLDREELLSRSVVANAKAAVLPTRGGENALLAARVLDLALKPEAPVTVLTVGTRNGRRPGGEKDPGDLVTSAFGTRRIERRRVKSDDPAASILREAPLGHDLLALGVTENYSATHQLSPLLRHILVRTPVPVLLVRHGSEGSDTALTASFERVIVPAAGTRMSRAAEEIAFTLARGLGAEAWPLHVIARADKLPEPTFVGERHPVPSVREVVSESADLARRFGQEAYPIVRSGGNPHEEVVRAADELGADLIVVGTQVRSSAPSLGHGTDYILDHASQTVLVIVLPGERGGAEHDRGDHGDR